MSPLDLLTIVFITLKLTGVIAWSWWWVTAPTWSALIVAVGVFAFMGWSVISAKRK